MTFSENNVDLSRMTALLNIQAIETVTRLSNINVDTDTIIKLIHSLNPTKAHGCDGISIGMLKLCATSISKLLHILFNNSVVNERFPNE